MTMPRIHTWPRLLLVLTVAVVAACSGDPAARAAAAVTKGDAYVAQKKLNEASIEYRKALQAEPTRADAHYKLAQVYRRLDDPSNAYAEYSRAADLDPSNVDAELQAGSLLLLGGEYDRARMRAELAIKADPKNANAHILLGNALAGMKDTGRALDEMQQAVELAPTSAGAYRALGAIEFNAGSRPRARAAFERAVALSPSSVDARLGLANYDWAIGDQAAAEAQLEAAKKIDPSNVLVHRALSLLYLTEHRLPEAEAEFQRLAQASPQGALALADFYMGTGRPEKAKDVLEHIDGSPAVRRQAALRTAGVLQAEGRHAEALAAADALIKQDPHDAEAHVLRARLLLTDPSQQEAAWQEARRATDADATSAAAQYTLGLVALARHDFHAAAAAFDSTLRLNPHAEAARLALARVRLAEGDQPRALAAASEAANASPDDPEAAVMLSRTLRAGGDIDRARREITPRVEKHPDDARLQAELGWIELASSHLDAARAAFETALQTAPTLEDARTGVVQTDLTAGKPAQARARVDGWLAATPHDPGVETLAARLDLLNHDPASAERRLEDVITRAPSRLDAYDMLGQIYVQQGQMDRALEKYKTLEQRAPDTPAPGTMIGLILQARQDRAGAKAQYESVIAKHPRAGVAANNLAWMLAEDGQLDEALKNAQIAAQELRDRPEAQDTLGWVYLQKHMPVQAVPAFQRAVDLAPQKDLYKQHLAEAQQQSRKSAGS